MPTVCAHSPEPGDAGDNSSFGLLMEPSAVSKEVGVGSWVAQ